jgi:hypothetical protein
MKVALIFADDGSGREDGVVGPFRSAAFLEGLRVAGIDPVLVFTEAGDHGNLIPRYPLPAGIRSLAAGGHGLTALLADEKPDVVQTFGPEHRLTDVWPHADTTGPLVHCISSWPDGVRQAKSMSAIFAPLAAARMRRASVKVVALLGTSRAAIGGWLTGGYFAAAKLSVVVAPPVARASVAAVFPAAPIGSAETAVASAPAVMNAAPETRTAVPVFGVHAPAASPDLIAFISYAVELTGCPDGIEVRLAVENPPAVAAPGISFVAAGDIDAFVAAIDVLAVAAYDDSSVAPVIAALRAGKSVIVPDCGGGAELIEYGRHGLMFCQGSPYHFANAVNIVSQSWGQMPVLSTDGGPAIAKTDPAAVAAAMVAVWERAVHPAASLRRGTRFVAGG